ncbi:MAG: TadE/TadG family type IV pilus assembly protein [Acidimicrobiales bacterium]|nr:TadE/TadG family type IV pilus assembly protein [Acidimicrobiales bacterium]
MTAPPVTGRRPPTGPGRGTRGQATVELALGLPIVLVGVLLVLQLALVGRDQLLVSHATREAARAAAVDDRAGAARAAAVGSNGALDPERLQVDADRRGDHVVVTVRYRAPTNLPLVGALVPDPTLHSRITMLIERSRS